MAFLPPSRHPRPRGGICRLQLCTPRSEGAVWDPDTNWSLLAQSTAHFSTQETHRQGCETGKIHHFRFLDEWAQHMQNPEGRKPVMTVSEKKFLEMLRGGRICRGSWAGAAALRRMYSGRSEAQMKPRRSTLFMPGSNAKVTVPPPPPPLLLLSFLARRSWEGPETLGLVRRRRSRRAARYPQM